jgi:O-methyltransferase domain
MGNTSVVPVMRGHRQCHTPSIRFLPPSRWSSCWPASSSPRRLRSLASAGVFTQSDDGLFGLTPLGETLTSGSPASMRDLAITWMETHYEPFGRLLAHILRGAPAATGVVFDLPHVVAEAAGRLPGYGLGDRLTQAAGDFFTAVPAGADTYLLSMVLHDWSDAEARQLLGVIKAAAPAGARLVAFELVVPDGDTPHMAKMIDLTMLGMLTGKERTQAEFRLLLEEAGFKFEGVSTTPTPVSVITALA